MGVGRGRGRGRGVVWVEVEVSGVGEGVITRGGVGRGWREDGVGGVVKHIEDSFVRW